MTEAAHRNWMLRLWRYCWSPSARWPFLVLILVGLVVGIVASGAFAVAMHFTSTNAFCSSCHENNVVPEWKASVHYANAHGVVVGCADCHEPSDPLGLMLRKVAATNEVWNQILGTISTPEKFEAHRWELAQKEWARLRADNSAECQHCHQMATMNDPAKAGLRNMHRTALANGQTCIDCHKGVAHKMPTQPTAAKGQH
jgi:cytochrome c-type protein NapC